MFANFDAAGDRQTYSLVPNLIRADGSIATLTILIANLHIMSKGNEAGVDFNPSRVVDPYGIGLASTENIIAVTRDVWRVVTGHVVPRVALASARVTRLDVARDFQGAMEPAQLILGLSRLAPPLPARPRSALRQATLAMAVSVVVGSLKNQVRLYRKDVESDGLASEGALRWECQVRSRPLRTKFGITDLFGHHPRVDHSTSGIALGLVQDGDTGTHSEGRLRRSEQPGGIPTAIKASIYWDLMERLARYWTVGLPPTHSRSRLCSLAQSNAASLWPVDASPSRASRLLSERLDWTKGTVISTYGLADGNSAASSSPAKGGTDD